MGLYDNTIGTLLVGIFFNTFLYGLVTYQFAMYYRTKFGDPWAIKLMVLFLFILDTFHSIAGMYMAWYYTVQNYDNPAVLELGLWPYQFTPVGTALAALVTQIYLGYRILCLTHSMFLYGVVITLAVPSFVLGLTCSVESAIIVVLSELPRIDPLVIAWLSTQVAIDTFITVTLIIIFSRWRGGFRKTDTILNRLIRGAIQTGLFAGIFSIGDLITFTVLPNTNLYGMFAIPIGRIYTNTLMDTLLAREYIRTEMDKTEGPTTVLGSIAWSSGHSSQATSAGTQSTSIQFQSLGLISEVHDCSSSEHTESKAIPSAV